VYQYKDIRITNKDYRTLIWRFTNAGERTVANGMVRLQHPCICGNYRYWCYLCPFDRHGDDGACSRLMAEENIEPRYLHLWVDHVSYFQKHEDAALREMRTIRRWIRTNFQKVGGKVGGSRKIGGSRA
jgi:hypothetical protein